MVERIYHVGLTVSDLDRSIAFYRDILGLEFQGWRRNRQVVSNERYKRESSLSERL